MSDIEEIRTRWKNTGQRWCDVPGQNYHTDVPVLLAEIERLTERCEVYKGQVKAGAVVIEWLRSAIGNLLAVINRDGGQSQSGDVMADLLTGEKIVVSMLSEIERLRACLRRYRTETPLGHQPHMIAHEADELLSPQRTEEKP